MMKWKLRERITLAIYAALGAFGSVALGFYGVGVYLGNYVSDWIPLGQTASMILFVVVAVLLLAWSIRVMLLAFKHEPKHDTSSVTVQHTDQGNGEVRISVSALDALVKQAIIGNSDGVADIKTHIVNHDDSISVRIEMSLNSDVHIPNATMLLQSSIKNFIEEFSGIAVRDVSVMVTTIIPVPPQLAISEKNEGKPDPAVVIHEDGTQETAEQPNPNGDPETEMEAETSVEEEEQSGEAEITDSAFAEDEEAPEDFSEEETGETDGNAENETAEERRTNEEPRQ